MIFSRLLNKDLIALLISVICSLILFFNNTSRAVILIQADLADTINYLTYPQKWYKNIFSIKLEYEKNIRNLALSQLLIAKLENHRVENIKLRAMLEFKDSKPMALIPANVTNKNSISIQTITINVGKNDSIQKNLPVLDVTGLLGKIHAVGKNASQVQLITDKNFSVSIRVGEDHSLGNFLPTIGKYGILQGIRKSMNLFPGEIAYTSGISDIYPSDIPVAKVISVNKNNNNPFQDVVVEILSDLDNLNYIFVIQ